MSAKSRLGIWGMATLGLAMLTSASADHRHGGYEDGEWKDEYWDGPCKVKIEAKGDEYQEEIKCPHGHGASWRGGEWQDEFWDGACKVKIEAKHDEFKKEVKCDDDD